MDWRDIAGALHSVRPHASDWEGEGQWNTDCSALVHVFLGEGDFDMDAFYLICETGGPDQPADARK